MDLEYKTAMASKVHKYPQPEPTFADIINKSISINPSIQALNNFYERANNREAVEVEGLSGYYNLRGTWSTHIAIYLYCLLAFQIGLSVLGIFNVNNIKSNILELQYFVIMVFSQNFLQIVGMALIVVKFLFKETQNESKKEAT